MTRCTGCNRDFTVSGYSNHIAQTTRSVCLAAFRAEVEAEYNRHRDGEPHTDATLRLNEDDNQQAEVGVRDDINDGVYQRQLDSDNEYAPFLSKLDWDVAKWAKTCDASPDAVTEFLQSLGVSTEQLVVNG